MASLLCGLNMAIPSQRRASPTSSSQPHSEKKGRRRNELRTPQNILKRVQRRKVQHNLRLANMDPMVLIGVGTPGPEVEMEEATVSQDTNNSDEIKDESQCSESLARFARSLEKQSPTPDSALPISGNEDRVEPHTKLEDSSESPAAAGDGPSTSSNDGNDSIDMTAAASLATAMSTEITTHNLPLAANTEMMPTVHTCDMEEEVDWSDESTEDEEILHVIEPGDFEGDTSMIDADDVAAVTTLAMATTEEGGGASLTGAPRDAMILKPRDLDKIKETITYFDNMQIHSSSPEQRENMLEGLRTEGVLPIAYHEPFPEKAPPNINLDGPVGTAILGLFERLSEGSVVTSRDLQSFPPSLTGFLLCMATGLRRVHPSKDPSLNPSFGKDISMRVTTGTGPAVAKVELNAMFRSYLRHHTGSLIRASLEHGRYDMEWVRETFPQLYSCLYDEEYKMLALKTTARARCGLIKRPEGRACWPCYVDVVDDLEREFQEWLEAAKRGKKDEVTWGEIREGLKEIDDKEWS